jgi:hypothetical protein
MNYLGEFDVHYGHCQFDMPEMSWTPNRRVAAGFAPLPWFQGAQPTIH